MLRKYSICFSEEKGEKAEKMMYLFEMFELEFQGKILHDSWAQADLEAVFVHESVCVKTKGFYAGNGIYKVRFLPELEGIWRWKVSGVFESGGQELCVKSDNIKNHGVVRTKGTHFVYSDGTWFYPFGTTVYALPNQEKETIQMTLTSLSQSPFNKVRMCVFPKHYKYNDNEPEYYAFEKEDGHWNVKKPCLKFWDHLEQVIQQLHVLGIEVDLILLHPYDRWGFSTMQKNEYMIYLDYLIRRLAAFPNIWWSLANEYDLMDGIACDWWSDFADFIGKNDPYHHLLSNHNIFEYWDFDNKDTTHCCIQDTRLWMVGQLLKKHNKPVVVDECCYEGNLPAEWGNLSGEEMVHRFWAVTAAGGYCTHGETYLNSDECIWWSKGGRLVGTSPERIAFLREILESLPGSLSCYVSPDCLSEEKVMEMKTEKECLARFIQNYPEKRAFIMHIIRQPWDVITAKINRGRFFESHYLDKCYLRYIGKQCSCETTMYLPEQKKYTVEVIDTWEMTRTIVLRGVSGKTIIPLPGKEKLAVLARSE